MPVLPGITITVAHDHMAFDCLIVQFNLFQGSTVSVSLFTVVKLFPVRGLEYNCETRLCSKLVHNAYLSLFIVIGDMAVVYGMYVVKSTGFLGKESESKRGCLEACVGKRLAEVAKFLLTLSKSGGLAVSAAWVTTDLLLVVNAAPGQGTLIFGSIAAAAPLLVLLADFVLWIWFLPAAVKRFAVMLTLLCNFDSVEHFLCKEINEYDHVHMLLILVSM